MICSSHVASRMVAARFELLLLSVHSQAVLQSASWNALHALDHLKCFLFNRMTTYVISLDACCDNLGRQEMILLSPFYRLNQDPGSQVAQRGHSVSDPSFASEVIFLCLTLFFSALPFLRTMRIKIPLSHKAPMNMN